MSLTSDKRNKLTLIVMIVVLVLATLFSMFLYQNAAVARIRNRAYKTLGAGVEQEKKAFIAGLDWQYLSLETIAVGVARRGVDATDPMLAELRALAEETDYLKVYLAFADGTSSVDNGEINIADRQYFQQSMAGQHGLELVESRIDGEPRFIISVPVMVDGQVLYVLYATCREETLNGILQHGISSDDSYALICRADGEEVIGGYGKDGEPAISNVFDVLAGQMSAQSLKTLQKDFTEGRSGIAAYGPSGAETYFAYVSLGVNGWMVCSAAPSTNVNVEVMQTVKSGYLIITAIMIVSAAFLLLFAYLIRQSSQRILHDQVLLNESDARYRMAIENSCLAIWDYDILKHRITLDERSMKIIGSNRKVIDDVPEYLIDAGYIHPDSVNKLREMHSMLVRGAKSTDGVVLIKNVDCDGWRYEHMRYTNLFDEKGVPYLAIGMGEDVTAEYIDKLRMNELSAAVECDSMTTLLNHGATFNYIKKYLKSEGIPGTHALFMIDIDDFKNVNDTLGHLVGDETIKEIALAIRKTFRVSDIVGRVGGDEFMVLMKNVPDMSYVKKKANELIEALRIPCQADGRSAAVSASVGVSVCRGAECVFEHIYTDADGALYRAKSVGKDRYVIAGEHE